MLKKSIKVILYFYYFTIDKILYRKKFKILNEYETVNKIAEERYSVSRYGDGEFKWMFGVKQNSFQDCDEELSKMLKESFYSNGISCLIGIPVALNTTKELNFEAKFYWLRFKCKYHKNLMKILDYNKIYCDASFTRPYIDYKDKTNAKHKFLHIKKIWDKRKILIVEGDGVNFGIGNDLLDNSTSIERIICPSKNAFKFINEIYESIIRNYKNHVILIALGPTASILCERLSRLNYQAIDIGHLDVEYCWYLNNCTSKVNIIGKNVNEKNKKSAVSVDVDKQKLSNETIEKIGINGDIYEK